MIRYKRLNESSSIKKSTQKIVKDLDNFLTIINNKNINTFQELELYINSKESSKKDKNIYNFLIRNQIIKKTKKINELNDTIIDFLEKNFNLTILKDINDEVKYYSDNFDISNMEQPDIEDIIYDNVVKIQNFDFVGFMDEGSISTIFSKIELKKKKEDKILQNKRNKAYKISDKYSKNLGKEIEELLDKNNIEGSVTINNTGNSIYISTILDSGEKYKIRLSDHSELSGYYKYDIPDLNINIFSFANEDKSLADSIENQRGIHRSEAQILQDSSYQEVLSEIEMWIKNNTEQMRVKNIKKGGNTLEQLQLAIVNKNGEAIQNIENPSEKVQLAAIQNYVLSFKYIKNPTKKVELVAVQISPNLIRNIKNPSEELQLAAVQKNGDSIQYINNPSEKIKLVAVQNNPFSIQHIDNSPEKLQLIAVNKNERTIRNIKNPSEKVQLKAVQVDVSNIKYIDNPTEKVQLFAVKKDPIWAIFYMKDNKIDIAPSVIEYEKSLSEHTGMRRYKPI